MSGYRVKDWDAFQQYHTGKNAPKKGKRPEWIKLYTRLIDDIEFHKLDPIDAKALVLLWSLASENGGALPPIETIAFRLRMTEKQIKSILSRLPHWLEAPVLGHSYDVPRPDKIRRDIDREENENAIESEFSENFWPSYPNKVGKPDALKSFKRQRLTHSLETILSGLSRYCSAKPSDRNWLNPATFLNQERFLDEPAEVAAGPPSKSRTQQAADRLMEEIHAKRGNGGFGGCGVGSNGSTGELPEPASRPRLLSAPGDDGSGQQAKRTVVEDDPR